ncbi:MAG: ComEC/Rec2 family competence protein [Clostridium sp.]|uniref:ComEC/Rec2 family competence protein n=1 Tax=Clostridium sp. TaxID=1506 RepID=UPI003F34AEE6
MSFKNIGKVKLAILYIAVTFLTSSLFYRYINSDLWLALIIVSLLFLWVFLKEGIEFSIFLLGIFVIGIIININFYNIKVNNVEKIRIERLYSYGGIGNINSRKVFLKGDLKGFCEGQEIISKGEFEKVLDKETGTIGEFKIESSKIIDKSIFTKLSKIKEDFKRELEKNIGMRKASLVTSIVFGRDSFLDSEDEEDMKKFGIIHALSVSGLHIGVIFLIFKKLFKEKVSLCITFLYVIMTGIAFSSLRAFVMLFCASLGTLVKKRYNPLGGIALSSIIIFFMAPYSIFTIGFLLSFSATLGIILFNKRLNRQLFKLPKLLRETISISLSAQVFTIPILIIFFNELSIGFIIGNLILIPVINLILILGIILIATVKIEYVFDFISFIILNVVDFLDSIMNLLDKFTPSLINLNENYGYFYITLIITYYLYKRGVKKIIVFPLSYILFACISLYSINPKILYRREGALIISYKGDRVVLADKNNKIRSIKDKTKASRGYTEFREINIKDECYLKKESNNYILNLYGDKYYLNMTRENKNKEEYDIINFKDKDVNEIIIIGKKLLFK